MGSLTLRNFIAVTLLSIELLTLTCNGATVTVDVSKEIDDEATVEGVDELISNEGDGDETSSEDPVDSSASEDEESVSIEEAIRENSVGDVENESNDEELSEGEVEAEAIEPGDDDTQELEARIGDAPTVASDTITDGPEGEVMKETLEPIVSGDVASGPIQGAAPTVVIATVPAANVFQEGFNRIQDSARPQTDAVKPDVDANRGFIADKFERFGNKILKGANKVVSPLVGLGTKIAQPFVKVGTKVATPFVDLGSQFSTPFVGLLDEVASAKARVKEFGDGLKTEFKQKLLEPKLNFFAPLAEVASDIVSAPGEFIASTLKANRAVPEVDMDPMEKSNVVLSGNVPRPVDVEEEMEEVEEEELKEVIGDASDQDQLQPIVDSLRPVTDATQDLSDAFQPIVDAVNVETPATFREVSEDVADILRPVAQVTAPVIGFKSRLAAPVVKFGADTFAPVVKIGAKVVKKGAETASADIARLTDTLTTAGESAKEFFDVGAIDTDFTTGFRLKTAPGGSLDFSLFADGDVEVDGLNVVDVDERDGDIAIDEVDVEDVDGDVNEVDVEDVDGDVNEVEVDEADGDVNEVEVDDADIDVNEVEVDDADIDVNEVEVDEADRDVNEVEVDEADANDSDEETVQGPIIEPLEDENLVSESIGGEGAFPLVMDSAEDVLAVQDSLTERVQQSLTERGAVTLGDKFGAEAVSPVVKIGVKVAQKAKKAQKKAGKVLVPIAKLVEPLLVPLTALGVGEPRDDDSDGIQVPLLLPGIGGGIIPAIVDAVTDHNSVTEPRVKQSYRGARSVNGGYQQGGSSRKVPELLLDQRRTPHVRSFTNYGGGGSGEEVTYFGDTPYRAHPQSRRKPYHTRPERPSVGKVGAVLGGEDPENVEEFDEFHPEEEAVSEDRMSTATESLEEVDESIFDQDSLQEDNVIGEDAAMFKNPSPKCKSQLTYMTTSECHRIEEYSISKCDRKCGSLDEDVEALIDMCKTPTNEQMCKFKVQTSKMDGVAEPCEVYSFKFFRLLDFSSFCKDRIKCAVESHLCQRWG